MLRRHWDPHAEESSEAVDRLGPFALRVASESPDDQDRLRDAYASSREHDPDLAQRHPESRREILEQEFSSRQHAYRIDFPGVVYYLLEWDGAPAGRLYLQLASTVVFVVDLVLFPPWRGRGHGTALLQELIDSAHASGRPVRLHVAKTNHRAAALYQRLGFQAIDELPRHWLLDLPPLGSSSAADSTRKITRRVPEW
jgi:ribosomal protein S18 acetylase RimI-like enzyme